MSTEYSDYMYVFWVKTGREEQALRQIDIEFGNDAVILQLMVERPFRKQGKIIYFTNYAFPGYIFVISEIENNDFIFRAKECARHSMSILKPLCYNGTHQAAMREDEREMIDSLWQGVECIETSTGFFEGDSIVITEGTFIGRESIIKEIHPRKLQAIVEIEFMGRSIRTTIGLEIIRKLS